MQSQSFLLIHACQALDQIISQIMENSNAHRPVPAPEEVVAKLPREVLMEGCKSEHALRSYKVISEINCLPLAPMLGRDCAVCKDQFKLDTEDPDEQVVVTLPCKHPFHQPCITPWLTSSGTCPVCRYVATFFPRLHLIPHSYVVIRFALVPQPDQHPAQNPGQTPTPANDSRPSPTQSSSSNNPNSPGRGPEGGNRNGPGTGQPGGGFIQSIFSNLMGLAHPQAHETDGGGDNSNRAGGSSHSHSRDNSTSSENAGQRGSTSSSNRGYPSSPPRDRPRSPPALQSSGSPSSPRWGTEFYRRSPLHSPLPSSPPYSSRAAPSSPTFSSRFRPGSPPSRRGSDHVRGSSAPPGSPGSAAQRRRDTQNEGHGSLPGGWSDDLD